ncbi:hypothetical protein HH214_09960 [Mucilaginibacter robiniae]|uniref:Uncharacterized protein n=1 Tax=Mucilaginibacter robiniae TaxID=2728022 RepID=A0A7L5DYJ6_9SPHI|nr:hypothetical protein [Mucilaginibacter robiniae]QJD96170.1 hypothetical protein HH214_09960 [Mucilaginibacter robiniae]
MRSYNKFFLIILILCIQAYVSYGQLKIDQNFKLDENSQSVQEFTKQSKFDYVLLHWSTSNWFNSTNEFTGVVKQYGQWYAVHIIRKINYKPDVSEPIIVTQKHLTHHQKDSLLRVLKADAAFNYRQKDFDSLPDTCSYMKNGVKFTRYNVMDANHEHLIRYTKSKFTYLNRYAPDYALELFAICNPKFNILKDYTYTIHRLYDLSKAITNQTP